MKTRKEVLQWLKDNELYDVVKRRLPVAIDRFPMLDVDMHQFFVLAFEWKYTSEGEDYWKEINNKFLEWYGKIPAQDNKKKKK